MINLFKEGDRVLILRKGAQVEATVKTTWLHEVQVRVESGELLWRTVKTIIKTLPSISARDTITVPAASTSLLIGEQTADGADSSNKEGKANEEFVETDQQGNEEEQPLEPIFPSVKKKSRKTGPKRSRGKAKP